MPCLPARRPIKRRISRSSSLYGIHANRFSAMVPNGSRRLLHRSPSPPCLRSSQLRCPYASWRTTDVMRCNPFFLTDKSSLFYTHGISVSCHETHPGHFRRISPVREIKRTHRIRGRDKGTDFHEAAELGCTHPMAE